MAACDESRAMFCQVEARQDLVDRFNEDEAGRALRCNSIQAEIQNNIEPNHTW